MTYFNIFLVDRHIQLLADPLKGVSKVLICKFWYTFILDVASAGVLLRCSDLVLLLRQLFLESFTLCSQLFVNLSEGLVIPHEIGILFLHFLHFVAQKLTLFFRSLISHPSSFSIADLNLSISSRISSRNLVNSFITTAMIQTRNHYFGSRKAAKVFSFLSSIQIMSAYLLLKSTGL